jgi:hypothetical protein
MLRGSFYCPTPGRLHVGCCVRIFLSHSSVNEAEAVALRDWLLREGWGDLFLDIDPRHLCFDFGIGKQGSRGVYLAVQEVF